MFTKILLSEPFVSHTFPFTSLQNLRQDFYQNPHDQCFDHCVLLSLLLVLFSSLVFVFRYPCDLNNCVWTNDDGCRDTKCAWVYLSIVRYANPNLELSSTMTYFSGVSVSYLYVHPVTEHRLEPQCNHQVYRTIIFSWSKDTSKVNTLYKNTDNNLDVVISQHFISWVHLTPFCS